MDRLVQMDRDGLVRRMRAEVEQTLLAVADAVNAVTNGTAAVDCGGWVCRDVNGAPESTVDINKFFEGGVNLKSLGFNNCLSTFVPHPVPEPSTYAMLLAGLGVVGFLARRRQA